MWWKACTLYTAWLAVGILIHLREATIYKLENLHLKSVFISSEISVLCLSEQLVPSLDGLLGSESRQTCMIYDRNF